MPVIPVYINPYPDELMYSWIHRLAKKNGLPITTFADSYLNKFNSKIGSLEYDIRYGLLCLNESFFIQKDLKEMFLSMSIFPFEAMFFSVGQQTRYVNNMFRKPDPLNAPVNTMIREIHICPQCIENDIEIFGEPYIHRAHQLSGVCTCHKHKAPLYKYTGIKDHECEYDLSHYTELEIKDIAIENEYTDYAQALFNSNTNCNIADLKHMIYNKLKELGHKATNGYEDFISAFNDSKLVTLFDADLKNFLLVSIISTQSTSARSMLPLLMYLFPNVQEIIHRFENAPPIIQKYHCAECGKNFYATPTSLTEGWGCTYCDANKSIDERYKKLIDFAGKGNYEPLEPFRSLNIKSKIHHKICGETIQIKPRKFIFDHVRCICESLLNEWDVRQKLEKFEDYEFISYDSESSKITMRSKACGHVFSCRFHKFIKYPSCRVCRPKNMTTELYTERVYDLVGDDYTVLSEFVDQRTKIAIKHNKCGGIQEYKPSAFLDGQRCNACNSLIVKKANDSWEKGYALLCEYKEECGTANIPKRDHYKGVFLGNWLQSQRDKYKAGKLTRSQEDALVSLGITLDPLAAEWERRYEQYKRYIQQNNGSSDITKRTIFEGEKLGVWVVLQRRNYNIGKLSEERYKKLCDINMKF